MPSEGRLLTPPEIVCSTCGEPVESFGVLDDDNRSTVWWEHLTEPEDDHDVTFPGPRDE